MCFLSVFWSGHFFECSCKELRARKRFSLLETLFARRHQKRTHQAELWSGLGWFGMVGGGLGWFGMVWTVLGWFGLVWDGLGLERAGFRSHTRSNRVCRKLINPKSCQKVNKKPWVSHYRFVIVGNPRFFFSFLERANL